MRGTTTPNGHEYNGWYTGGHLDRIAFPLGGLGAGMVCVQGAGGLTNVSVRNRPEVFNEPLTFSAITVRGVDDGARVLEGPVPSWKVLFPWGGSSGNGAGGTSLGLPRFAEASFLARFPFATVRLRDSGLPVDVDLTAWSPFTPPDPDDSSLPVAALEYAFTNTSKEPIEITYSFHSRNFMAVGQEGARTQPVEGGFSLVQPGTDACPTDAGAFCASVLDGEPAVNCAWFRGGWYDPLTMVWKEVVRGEPVSKDAPTEGEGSPGASLWVPLSLDPSQTRTVRLLLCWHVPTTNLCHGSGCTPADYHHRPWYAGRFEDVDGVLSYWRESYDRLHSVSASFRDCFYDTTLPAEVVEAVAANLSILKSPTVLRQTDGRLWAYEGCSDTAGSCMGSCTHVWNYAQAVPHLFPALERTLRETEFLVSQDERGHQVFRTSLPIRPAEHTSLAAADGQLGGIVKVYREWRICGDLEWMRGLWPQVRRSLEYCIETWDPEHQGVLVEPHHNTYDIEFWGPDGMCSSFYLAALAAATAMGEALGEEVEVFRDLGAKGKGYLEKELYNGEYFHQKVVWKGLRAGDPSQATTLVAGAYSSPEAIALLGEEGPKYQYGSGCLSDGVLGAWLAWVAGLDHILDARKVASHLEAVYRYNFREDLALHANPQRPSYALGHDAGLLLCSWPRGGEPSLPFVYSNEVWTGIEYQVASHLMGMGEAATGVEEGLRIVRACRDRYDGRRRNPFDEIECGHWYARAMSSYALLFGLSGARYDGVDRTLYVQSREAGDFRVFLCTQTGFGTVECTDGRVSIQQRSGKLEIDRIVRVESEDGGE